MPPSLLSAVASTALLATCALASDKAYQKYDSYKGNNFFNHFDFWESKVTDDPNTVDPTSGFINYRNESDAWDLGLIGYKNGLPYMGVDHTNIVDSDGPLGRSSVRLESKKEYDQGLFIFDMAYLPKPASGSWPAIWTYGENWPYTGDIDIYENWNDNFDFNRQTLHTGDGCTVQGSDMSAEVETHNCNALYSGNGQSEFQGCSADDHGEGAWGDASGGVYAVEWNGDHIKMWHFRSNKVPSDITQGCPDPTGWGQPTFNTAGGSGSCDIDSHYGSQKIVFNLDFCGVAGDFWAWSQSSAYTKLGETSCTSYVANNPHTFKDVYFLVNSVDIYKFDVVSSSTSSSLLSTSTSSVASSVSTSSVITTSSSIASTTSSGIGSSTSSPVSESSSLTSSTQSTVSGTSSATTSYSASSLMNTSSSASLTRSTSTMSSYITSSTSTDDGDYCEDDITSSPVTLLSSTSSAVSTSTASVSGTSSLGGSTSTISLSIATSLTGSASSSIASATFSQAQSSESSSLISTSSLTFGTTNRAPHFVSASSSANAGSASATSYATSTIYTTAVYTITSCKPEVTDCPAKLGKVTTETIAASTTVCPVTETSAPPNPTITSNLPVGYTTSTRYVTKVYTITSCAPTVTNCHVGSITTEVKTT
ncbi:concanavalin A-like lectin/glucanase domain-containing protein, partial [Xylariales sp. AK1849]